MTDIYDKLLALPVIDPNVQGKLCTEEEFIEMVKPLLPNFPNDVLGQWAYDNYDFFCDKEHYKLNYELLIFEKRELNYSEIELIRDDGGYYGRDMMYDVFSASEFSSLAQFMLKNGTWPHPIIVLSADNELRVIEGHMRYAYLRQMIDRGVKIQEKHFVWIATEMQSGKK